MPTKWITAGEALMLVASVMGEPAAYRAICSRLYAGIIRSKATSVIIDGRTYDRAEIPKEFWETWGEPNFSQNWGAGDFTAWVNNREKWTAFGISLSRRDVEALVPTGKGAGQLDTRSQPTASAGGRPTATWWEDLWIDLCRRLYIGDLKPTKQSEIQAAMEEWVSAHGHSAAASTLRERARKLWKVLKDEN